MREWGGNKKMESKFMSEMITTYEPDNSLKKGYTTQIKQNPWDLSMTEYGENNK